MSENRSLAVLEILVHLSATIPDRYLLGASDVSADVAIEFVSDQALSENWSTLDPREQGQTRGFGDTWVREGRTAILSVPSVIAGERNYVLNPAHPHFLRVTFADPVPFHFDIRLLRSLETRAHPEHAGPQ